MKKSKERKDSLPSTVLVRLRRQNLTSCEKKSECYVNSILRLTGGDRNYRRIGDSSPPNSGTGSAAQDGKTAPPQGAGAERTSDSDAGADNEAASPGARGPEEEAPLSLPSEEARGTEQEFAATAEDPGGDEGEPLGDEQDDDPACDPS